LPAWLASRQRRHARGDGRGFPARAPRRRRWPAPDRPGRCIPREPAFRAGGTLLHLQCRKCERHGHRNGLRSHDRGPGTDGRAYARGPCRWWSCPHPSFPPGRWDAYRAATPQWSVLQRRAPQRWKVKLRSFVYYHLLTGTKPDFYRIIRLHKAVAPGRHPTPHGLKSPSMSTDNHSSSDKTSSSRPWLRRLLLKATVLFAGLGLSGALLGGLALALAWPNLPDLSAMIDYRPRVPLRIYTADKVLIGEFGEERRNVLRFDEIPDVMKAAILAAEDDNFYQHHGIDWMGVARAALANLTTMAKSQGASTITMQVARNF